jgi:lipoprotein signal peptidase
MLLSKDTSKFNSKLVLLISSLIGVNFLLSFFVQYYNFKSVENYFPAGFGFGWVATILIFGVGTFLIYRLNLLTKFPLLTALIIAGSLSNFLEYTIFGFVVDYIDLGIAVLNLADVEIYGGLVILNWMLIKVD